MVPLDEVLCEYFKKAEVHMEKHYRDAACFPKEWSKTFQEANTDKMQKSNVLKRQSNCQKTEKPSISDMTLSLSSMTNKVTHTKTSCKLPSGFNYSY